MTRACCIFFERRAVSVKGIEESVCFFILIAGDLEDTVSSRGAYAWAIRQSPEAAGPIADATALPSRNPVPERAHGFLLQGASRCRDIIGASHPLPLFSDNTKPPVVQEGIDERIEAESQAEPIGCRLIHGLD